MKYSYEYKKQCVELYRQGKWPETPVGEKQKNFHKTIRKWARMEEAVEDNRLLCYTGQVATPRQAQKRELTYGRYTHCFYYLCFGGCSLPLHLQMVGRR